MENEANRALGTASGMQHITRTGYLGTGQSVENERQFSVVIGGTSGAIPHTATTRPCRRSTQQQETHPVETVSQAKLGTTKTGKPCQHIHWSDEINTFIVRQYYIITKLETIKIEYNNKVKSQWSQKALHGRHPYDLSQQYVDLEALNKWLTSADLFAETKGFLTAIQNKVILTRNYKKYILKQPNIDELCRRFGKESETIQRMTAACEQLAPTEYVKRHDGLATVIHQKLAEAAELIEDKSPHYKYTPASVNFKLYWNRSILTDKTVSFNGPDITFMNKKTKNTLLIDIAVLNTHNLVKTITVKQNKYQELANEISAMWKQNAVQVIPIVISSTGVIPKSLAQSLKRLYLHPNTCIQMQKSVILGTCSMVRNFLNYK
jgi:hypothetical protein